MNDFLSIANNRNTPASILVDLAASTQDKKILRAIAQNPNSPPDLLVELAGDYLEEIGNNPALDLMLMEVPDLILKIHERHFQYTYNGHIPIPNWYLKLATSHNKSELRQFIAENEIIPISYLERLSEDPCPLVRCGVAINYRTPISILEKLALDPEPVVKIGLVSNPHSPLSVLEQFADDRNENVKSLLSLNQNLSPFISEKLANDKSEYVRRGVAVSSVTPKKVLKQLAKDLEEEVREKVASNPHTPRRVLQRLSEDPVSSVREAVTRNPNAPIFTVFKFTFSDCSYQKWMAEKNLAARFSLILSTLILTIIAIFWYQLYLLRPPFYVLIFLGLARTITFLIILLLIWPGFFFIKEIFSRSIEKISNTFKTIIYILSKHIGNL